MSERLTAKTAATFRASLHADQNGRCALCGEPLPIGEAVLDHDHTTGQVRGVLHRGCNAMLGHIENNRARNHLSRIVRLAAWSKGLVPYLYAKRDDMPLYYTHRTAAQKAERRTTKARLARAARKARGE